ncbi:hypothetical protein [Thermoproteus tenax]|uniref:Uncharacterized protein n=1 Tax=Thermoproteus tenax (strain ATCC 35583 / DSM 2078 / JCM 9277 / NBRC 100435 / Kra 1) TaxID=768679 RepID=G4RPU6_THETK|nr:hypothetical protein [Thermoproteus tenax]CCC81591.1 hypothetical protein TTX_0939 [Thermoproteus tenax Kra 1]
MRTKFRYLLIRAEDVERCLEELNLGYIAVLGLMYRLYYFDLIGIYDDIIVVRVPRALVRRSRALIALLEGCRTVKVRGTLKSARKTAMSIRRAQRIY